MPPNFTRALRGFQYEFHGNTGSLDIFVRMRNMLLLHGFRFGDDPYPMDAINMTFEPEYEARPDMVSCAGVVLKPACSSPPRSSSI